MEKINIAQLLKDCPQGMELDCTLYDNIFFYEITDDPVFPIRMKRIDGHLITLTKYGEYANCPNAKCIIFPKGKTTWEGFIPPCQLFKDGDIVVNKIGKPFILKSYDLSKNNVCTYCGINCWDNFELSSEDWTCARDIRYATEEEKAKLFDVIKANGYRWNSKAKTLECHPKFKIGDWVVDNCSCVWKIEGIINQFYILECPEGGESRPTIDWADRNFHLWTIQDAKDGDIILTHCDSGNTWISIFKKRVTLGGVDEVETYADVTKDGSDFYSHSRGAVLCNEEDILYQRLATEEEKQKLLKAIEDKGYRWNSVTKTLEKSIEKPKPKPKFKVGDKIVKKNSIFVPALITKVSDDFYYSNTENSIGVLPISEQDNYELVPDKFDINTLIPFESKVLVREKNTDEWRGHFFSHYDNNSDRPYICIGVEGINEYKQCIPYEGNEHLLGKTNDCSDYYKNW